MSEEVDLLDQTLYLASRIYHSDDSPIPLDIHSACAIGNYNTVRNCIDQGIDFNRRNKAGWTSLMYASYVGHDTVVNLLLDSGAEASKGTPTGLTPLMVAAGCGNESVCYFLVQNGANLDSQDEYGYTALVHAVRQGHQTAVQLLLETGADMELVDNDNAYTALMFAAIEGDEIIADILVACGADIGANDRENHNARFLAFKRHNVRIVTLLDNAMYMYRPMSETPTNDNVIIEEPVQYNREDSSGGDYDEENSDLYSGAKEMEAYQESIAIKKSIQYNLGRRSGPRWSLPHQYIGERRLSKSDSNMFSVKHKKKLRSAMSMPERANPPAAAFSPEPATPSPEPSPLDPKMAVFLSELGLEKYISVLHEQEIDYDALTSFNEDDLKRIGVKLMGPRKKLSLAIAELKEQKDKEVSSGNRSSISSHDDKGGILKRPKLTKQSSTDVAEAYRGAMETIAHLEEKVAQEHHLRKTADSFLLELQTTRRQAVGSVVSLVDSQKDISKHCNAVRSTHQKLSDELDNLRVLSSSSIEPHEFQILYTEIISLKSKMNMELEALSRSIDLTTELTNTLSFQLKANS